MNGRTRREGVHVVVWIALAFGTLAGIIGVARGRDAEDHGSSVLAVTAEPMSDGGARHRPRAFTVQRGERVSP